MSYRVMQLVFFTYCSEFESALLYLYNAQVW